MIFPGNLQLSRKCFQKTLNYRDNFINYRDSFLAISWQKYATIFAEYIIWIVVSFQEILLR